VKLSADEFRAWEQKSITLLGMSGVGKTRLAKILRRENWFHYCADYRIGTRYLDEAILDNVKQQAMKIPFLRELLRSDSIYLRNNITVDNLKPVSCFLGKLGNPEQNGLSLREFKRRQELYRQGEIAAMKDVPEFIRKAREIYGYQHFVNDAGGSICELDDNEVMPLLAKHTLILYIKATAKDEQELIRRAEKEPKPLYYREAFLDEHLASYLQENHVSYYAMIDPDTFVRWMFPKLFYARIPRYETIAQQYGYTVTTDQLGKITHEADFLHLLEQIIAQQS